VQGDRGGWDCGERLRFCSLLKFYLRDIVILLFLDIYRLFVGGCGCFWGGCGGVLSFLRWFLIKVVVGRSIF